MSQRRIFTYQTRIHVTPAQAAALDAYAELYGRVERTLFAAIQRGDSPKQLKGDFMAGFGLTARQFNAILFNLRGKIASVKERRPGLIVEKRAKIIKFKKVVAKLSKKAPGSAKLHYKKRRLETLGTRLARLEADEEAGAVRLCFGSRKLFRAQFALEANGYDSFGAWRNDWRAARASQIFVLGSQDENAGCPGCVATQTDDKKLSLSLRLPNALTKEYGAHLKFDGVRLAYGQDKVEQALAPGEPIPMRTKKDGKPYTKRTGTAVSYRFLRDAKGWRVFVSVEAPPAARVTHRLAGAIGVDINANHLAIGEVGRHGNLNQARRIGCVTYGLSDNQASALIGDIAVGIARDAAVAVKPVVLEALDFAAKKAGLESADPKGARMLSSFAYNKSRQAIRAACFRAGVEVIEV